MKALRSMLLIGFSLLLSLMLTMLPLPYWAEWFIPDWALMVLIYWAMALPHRIGVGVAFGVGLFIDILQGSLLGEHALALTVVVAIVAYGYKPLRLFPLAQQAVCLLLLSVLYEGILLLVNGVVGGFSIGWQYWSPAVINMLLWPWLYILLRDYRRRFRVC